MGPEKQFDNLSLIPLISLEIAMKDQHYLKIFFHFLVQVLCTIFVCRRKHEERRTPNARMCTNGLYKVERNKKEEV